MKEYDAYLFDADGTLIDTRELIFQSFLHMGKEIGETLPKRDLLEGTVGLPLRTALPMILGEGFPEAYYENAAKVYSDYMLEHFQEYLRAFPGTGEILADLAGRGKKLAVVTSRGRGTLELFLDYLGLRNHFAALVTPENTVRHKPDPEPALYALRLLDAEAERAVFIGDAVFDIQCGFNAGMDTVLVRWGGMDPAGWTVQPGFIINRFEELLPTI